MPQSRQPSTVPVGRMTVEQPFDSAEYLDGPAPTYEGEPPSPTAPAEPEDHAADDS